MNNLKCFGFLLLSVVFIACDKQNESSKSKTAKQVLTSKVLQREVSYQIYFPKTYQDSLQSFPIIYLLHGHGGDEKDWFQKEEGNVASLLDSLIDYSFLPPSLAVSVNAGNSWYVNGPEAMQDFYLKEFIPFVESTYRVNTKSGRIIAGNSVGGYGALRFSLLKPSFFKEVILLSPASYEPLPPAISSSRKIPVFAKDGEFNDSIWNSYSYTHLWENLQASKKIPQYHLSVGDDDAYNIVPVVTTLQQRMLKDTITNELRITNGGHDWKCWKTNFASALVTISKKD